jgi:inhibitor of cysteine peptidase
MKHLVLAAVLLAALLLAAGCTTTPPSNATATPTPTAAPNATIPVYTMNDSGRTVPLGLNQSLEISLPENPSTGYTWNASMTTGLMIVDSEYTADPASAGMAGSGGTRTWTVQGVLAGTQQFSAVYVRPWEPNLAAEQFNLTVQVG